MTEYKLIIYKKFASDDEEQDDTFNYLGSRLVQLELAGDLGCAVSHKHKEKRNQQHHERVELRQPGHNDGGKSASAGRAGGDGMRASGNQQETGKTADSARQGDGSENNLFYVDAGVARRVFTFTDDRYFVPMLGVFQINVHEDHQCQHNDQIEAVVEFPEETRKEGGADPAGFGFLVNNTDGAGSLFRFPDNAEKGRDLDGDVVHHQREQGFIRIPVCLENARNDGPDQSRQAAGYDHAQEKQRRRHGVTAIAHERRRNDAAGQNLPLAADIPESHFEGGSNCQRNRQQDHRIADGAPASA